MGAPNANAQTFGLNGECKAGSSCIEMRRDYPGDVRGFCIV